MLGIVNVVGSSIAREADTVMYTWAGPEIAVATTKAYSSQLIALYLLAMKFAEVRGVIGKEELHGYIEDLKKLPDQVEMLLNNKTGFRNLRTVILRRKTCFLSAEGSIMRSLWRVH